MSCVDLKDYFLKELPRPQALQVEAHLRDCPSCREELDRLRLTEAALFSLRDEEIPKRIAFVSDPVFEPSAPRRWWTAFWNSAPRLGFASAAILSAALVISAFRPVGDGPVRPEPPAITTAAAPSLTPEDVQRQIEAAVSKAMAESRAETTTMLASLEKANAEERRKIISIYEEALSRQRKLTQREQLASYQTPAERGEAQ